MLKKIFLSLMAVVLMVGLLPTVALADESSNANDGTENNTAVGSYVSNISADTSSEIPEDTPLSAVPLADDDIDSGTIGTCTWVIDSDGCLTIAPEDGVSGEFSVSSPSSNSWPWYQNSTKILTAKVEPGVSASGSLAYMFNACSRLTTIDLSGLDTSHVTNMGYMFSNCSALVSLDLSGLDTSNVTNMGYMFRNCTYLTTIDLSGLDTSNVTDMGYMFQNCSSLTSLNLSGLDTSKVTNMYDMFYNCTSLTSLDLSGLDTSKVTNMYSMFYNCTYLTSLDLSGLDTSHVTSMGYMFYNCSALVSLDLSGLDTSHVTSMGYMFYNCSALVSLDLSGLDTSHVTSMDYMFENCSSLTSLDLSSFDTSNVTDMRWMFYNCTSLTSLDLSGLDTSNVTSMYSMFYNCTSLTSLDLSGLDTSHVTDMVHMFYNCTSLKSLDLSGLDTSNVTSMYSMFYNCTNLRTIIVGERFTLASSFPVPIRNGERGKWMSDDGTVYDSPSDIPSNVAATYTAVFPANTTALEATIKTVEALNSVNYTSESWAAMEAALSKAIDVLADVYATQDEIDAANTNLQNAIDNLVYIVDTSVLESLIKKAESLNSADYTASSWIILQSTLSYTKTIFADIASTQTEVNDAADALNTAINSLVSATDDSINKTELTLAIETADALVASEYTADSWAVLTEALDNAKKVEADESATQSAIDLAADALDAAISSLVKTTKTMSIYAGSDRYATSQRITKAIADKSGEGSYEGVIVCSAQNGKFADALCAAGLSGLLGYPIVLVDGSYEPAPNTDEGGAGSGGPYPGIYYLVGYEGDIIILGGESTINDYVTNIITNWYSNGDVTRIAGADRYATAEAVYEYGETHGGWSSDYAVLAKGNDFPDALGAASFCTTNAAPMLLTDQNSETLSGYVTNAAIRADEVVIVGGTSSVSTAKENTLRNYATVERFGEATRYETNLSFARWQLNHGMSIDSAGVATGTNFPDALGSSYLLSLTSSVLLLTSKTESENTSLYNLLADNAQTISSISIFGGDNSVPAGTRTAIQSVIGGEWNTVNK